MMKHFMRSSVTLVALLALVFTISALYVGCGEKNEFVQGPASVTQSQAELAPLSKADQRVQAVMAVQERHSAELMAIPGVNGTGVGADERGNPVLLVLTERPLGKGVAAAIEGIRTRIEVVGEVHAFAAGYKGTYRPVPGGVSVGNANECASGTIGCMVEKGGTRYMLSNNHVFARINAAAIGEAINQPGRYDGKPICSATGIVGALADFVPISFGSRASNVVDCAIASISVASTCAMAKNLYTPSSTVVSPSVGLAVKKVGRTSGLTTGTIAGINVTISVNYGNPGVTTFTNQIYVASSFIRSGDSGSLMVTNDANANPVGLNFAGGSGTSFANPIGPVLQQLGVTVCSN